MMKNAPSDKIPKIHFFQFVCHLKSSATNESDDSISNCWHWIEAFECEFPTHNTENDCCQTHEYDFLSSILTNFGIDKMFIWREKSVPYTNTACNWIVLKGYNGNRTFRGCWGDFTISLVFLILWSPRNIKKESKCNAFGWSFLNLSLKKKEIKWEVKCSNFNPKSELWSSRAVEIGFNFRLELHWVSGYERKCLWFGTLKPDLARQLQIQDQIRVQNPRSNPKFGLRTPDVERAQGAKSEFWISRALAAIVPFQDWKISYAFCSSIVS